MSLGGAEGGILPSLYALAKGDAHVPKDSSYDSGMPIEKYNRPSSADCERGRQIAAPPPPRGKLKPFPQLAYAPPQLIRVLAAGHPLDRARSKFTPPLFFLCVSLFLTSRVDFLTRLIVHSASSRAAR